MITPYHIIDVVCKCLNLDWYILISQDKHREYADGRFIAMTLIRERVKIKKGNTKKPHQYSEQLPYKQISYLFQRCHHTTASDAELETKKLIKTDKDFKKKYDMVVNLLDSNVNIA